MGEGLYHDPDGRTVYAEPYDHLDEDADDLDRVQAWQDFHGRVIDILGDRWSGVGHWSHNRGVLVVAQSGLHGASLHEDSYARVHLTIAPRDDLEPPLAALSAARLDAVARRVFDMLAQHWALRVRACAWTSRPYQPASDRRAA
jgi:hypothetical protein